MNIIVPVKLVPDLVEELSVDASGTSLDTAWLRMIINEFDDHAIEQAILLKEQTGAHVTIMSTNVEGVDDLLFTAAAKGADRLIKLNGDFEAGVNNHALARAISDIIKGLQPDLVLTGVQAHNDLDGQIGPLLAGYLDMPYVGGVSGFTMDNSQVLARKEYPGGLLAEMAVRLPAVLGIQAAEQPPRYVAISKIRQVMKSTIIEEQTIVTLDSDGGPTIDRMFKPEVSEYAIMIEGDINEICTKLIEIFKVAGVL